MVQDSQLQGGRRSSTWAHATVLLLAAGCVTEQVSTRNLPGPPAPRIFEFPPPGAPPAGTYHGVSLFFELGAEDLPEVKEWMDANKERTIPPIIPESTADDREVYKIRDLHRVEYHHALFEVGGYRYPREPNARLYVFKKRTGAFSFVFRGQGIVVSSDVPWIPSIYYYVTEEAEAGGKPFRKEVVQVGLARIEAPGGDDSWLVNGRKYYPDTKRPLELWGAVHAAVAR